MSDVQGCIHLDEHCCSSCIHRVLIRLLKSHHWFYDHLELLSLQEKIVITTLSYTSLKHMSVSLTLMAVYVLKYLLFLSFPRPSKSRLLLLRSFLEWRKMLARRKKKAVTSMPRNTPATKPTTAPTIVQVWSVWGAGSSTPPICGVSIGQNKQISTDITLLSKCDS